MSEQIPEPSTGNDIENNDTHTEEVDVEALIKERDKWRAMSRKHEENWKTATQERDELRKAGLSEAERALADAVEKARSEAYSEVGSRLAAAELRAAAAAEGIEIPETVAQFLDVSRFIGPDGSPDTGAITSFIDSMKPQGPKFAQNVGVGPQGGSGVSRLTREDLSRMSPQQINEARKEGRLNHLLLGET
jgi:hypothetical protein